MLAAARRVIEGRDFYFVVNGAGAEFDGAATGLGEAKAKLLAAVRRLGL